MNGSQLLERMEYRLLCGNLETEIDALCMDNRKVQSQDAFICIKGARFDTHDCIKEIADKGASFIVVSEEWASQNNDQKEVLDSISEKCAVIAVEDTRLAKAQIAAAWYGHPADYLTTIGITGSKGKTTTTHMLADMLMRAGYKTGTIGTNGAIIDGVVHELNNTTPDSEELQMYLSQMVKEGVTHAVIECSSQGLMQHRTGGFTFDFGIFTNIAEGDHVGPNEHKTFEEYLYCKSLLIRNSRAGIINADDVHSEALLSGVSTPCIFYGEEGNTPCHKTALTAYHMEKTFDGKNPGISFDTEGILSDHFEINMPGLFNVGNAMAAILAAKELNVPVSAMKETLKNLSIKGRIDMVYRDDKISVCVDFAHNGYSTRNLLTALREYRPKRLVCIFGADGNRAKSRRYEMGEASGKLADLSIVTSGHNRYETFEQIFEDIKVGLAKTTGTYLVIADRKEAIRYAIENAEEGDLITIIGLGHENYQEENGVKYPYSDTDYVLQVVKELKNRVTE